jgi:tetratricopeptide (TPR) repeat protein
MSADPPDPTRAGTLDDLAEALRQLKVWAGNPSFEQVKDRVNATWTAQGRPAAELVGKSTVADCFRAGRRRLNVDLVTAVVRALHPDSAYVERWRGAVRVVSGELAAAALVRVQTVLPPDLDVFTGRAAELDALEAALRSGPGVVVVSGMAGVGKTRLAVRVGHLLARRGAVSRSLFVDLRGYHADPAKPPADPAAVLEGFLRALGVPGHRIPPTLDDRTAAYRRRLAEAPTLVVLDNVAGADQVRPLLADAPGCLTVVTSRRALPELAAAHVSVDVFDPAEARDFLSGIALDDDPGAVARIADRCGHLPLALGLVAGHIRATTGWTLADHADRLDEHHRNRQLDTGVELALALSYRHLPPDRRRVLRLAALHPGRDLDAHAVAALAATDVPTSRALLTELCDHYLLQPAGPDRYAFHDLVRVFASGRTVDEDSPTQRRAALGRLFDHYLETATAAVDSESGRAWLDSERPALAAVTAHAAEHGWPGHAVRLSSVLFRYLLGGHHGDATDIHHHALRAARRMDDLVGQAQALTHLGATRLRLGDGATAVDLLRRALNLWSDAGDDAGTARALANLGDVEQRLGRYRSARESHSRALDLYHRVGDLSGAAHALTKLGIVDERTGRYEAARAHHSRALTLFERAGDPAGRAAALSNLGDAETRLGHHASAVVHLRQALVLYRRAGNRDGEAWALGNVGTLEAALGRFDRALAYHRRALAMHSETGERHGEAYALNGLGEAALALGRAEAAPGDPGRMLGRAEEALAHHTAALEVATAIGDTHQQARAADGLGDAHAALGSPAKARHHHEWARSLYALLDAPEETVAR